MFNEMKRKFTLYQLNSKKSFAYFITDTHNEEAFYATVAPALNLERLTSLLVLYGKAGMGKTHLLQATAYEILAEDPYKDVVYVTSELVIDAYRRSDEKLSSRKTYHEAELLILDDIHFFKEDQTIWEEVFEILEYRSRNSKKTILSCDDSLYSIKNEIDSVWNGKTEYIEVGMPDYKTCIRILEKKIRQNNLQKYQISKEVIEYLAKNASENVRVLEGMLYKIIALSNLENAGNIDVPLIKEWLNEGSGDLYYQVENSNF